MISRILKEEGVPQDLIYLAQAESGFQPLALSRAGARGMWQFMAASGELYGLQRSWWVDERQDPEKATRAAARHLKDLYNQFGDWYLAMAAYNSGASTVQHAVERTGYADFWELYRRGVLPQETRNYVPIILAVTIMAKNPEQYGLERVAPDPAPQMDQVTIDYPVDLRLVAECVDTSVNYLQELNPSLLRMTTPKDQSFTLNLPAGSREKYENAMAAIPPDMRTWWRYHRVEYGDTLASIARKYHTSPSSIAEANSLTGDEVKVGSKLIIPVAPGARTPKPPPIRTMPPITKYARATRCLPWPTISRFRSISCGNGTTYGERRWLPAGRWSSTSRWLAADQKRRRSEAVALRSRLPRLQVGVQVVKPSRRQVSQGKEGRDPEQHRRVEPHLGGRLEARQSQAGRQSACRRGAGHSQVASRCTGLCLHHHFPFALFPSQRMFCYNKRVTSFCASTRA